MNKIKTQFLPRDKQLIAVLKAMSTHDLWKNKITFSYDIELGKKITVFLTDEDTMCAAKQLLDILRLRRDNMT